MAVPATLASLCRGANFATKRKMVLLSTEIRSAT
jgi:hypothetical protein